jgi:translocation and assembly module TamB
MEDDPPESPARPRRRWRVLRALGLAVAGFAALVLGALWGIDTGPGHRLIADRIAAMRPSSGLRIRIGRIDGSIWTRATLRDVRLYDLDGQFFEAPELALAWHPTRWLHNRLDIDRLAAPLVTLDRAPRLRSKPGSPILPGFDIRIGRLDIRRLRLGPAIAGRAHVMRLLARADIHDRRALIQLRARSGAGDRVQIDLDAEPDGDRFALAAAIDGPADGVVAGMAGLGRPVGLRVAGRGTWRTWDGTARGTLGARRVIDLALAARAGHFQLSGTAEPSQFLKGKAQRLTAPGIRIRAEGDLADRRLSGRVRLASPALRLAAAGAIDLADSRFDRLRVDADLLRPPALFPNMTGRNVRLQLDLDGPFATADFRYQLASPHIAFDETGFDGVRATGAGRLSRAPVAIPVRLQAARVTGAGAVAGGILANLKVAGTLRVDPKTLVGRDLALSSDKLKGTLQLRIDLVTGRYDVALAGGLARYFIQGLGIVDVMTRVTVLPGPGGRGTIVAGTGQAIVRRFDNAFLRSLAGGDPRIDTRLVRGPDGIIRFSDLVLTGPAIRITGSGLRRRDGSFLFDGQGRQDSYGTFRLNLDGQIDHPKVRLALDQPVPALGVTQATLDLDPDPQGFQFRAAGGSYAGPFQAHGAIRSVPNQPTVIDVADIAVSGTHGQGTLRSDPGGFTGALALAGGGISGTIGFSPQGTVQRIEPRLQFARATIAAATPIAVGRGRANGVILLDPAGTTIDGTATGLGLQRGNASISRLAAEAHLRAGNGTVALTASGARGRGFNVRANLLFAPGRLTVSGGGTIENRDIQLAEPAVLMMTDEAWQLQPTRITYAGGGASLSGRFALSSIAYDLQVQRMPLSVLDLINPTFGFGGYGTGRLSYRHDRGSAPSGRLDMAVRGLTRSGLVLTSQPVDLGLAAVLTANGAGARAVVTSNGRTIGRAQARMASLPPGENIVGRLIAAPLFAQLRYSGPADTLWRLVGVETINLSGPLSVAADVGGTPANPLIRGTVRTDNGRLESAVTGTVVQAIKASGSFDGSRLVLDTMSGRAGDGTVTGRGSFEFGAGRGLGIDLALTADNAVLLNRDDMGATVSGPLTLKSNGVGGTIGGDVTVDRGRFRLGSAASAQVPHLTVTELNRPDEGDIDDRPPPPWTLDLKARARSRLMVTGLGLDSEWRADLTIKGAVDNPAIGGRMDLIRGGYQFSGRRFNLDRGMIRFTGEAPPDPVLDITALADVQGFNATIHVTGTGLRPDINFQSVPALPEDELLSRLLFGTSITNLSAPEALQLAAAVASLRTNGGGGGLNLDPINAVRKAVRLDRLRILPADVTTGQKTSVAAGKNIGRRTYVELVTDGAGYSATTIEYRITRWLSVLSSISTIGRQSANVRVSRDY